MTPNDPQPSLCIILGAGASVAAGMPSTGEITERVLSGEGIVHHTDSLYYLSAPNPNIPDGFTWRAVEVARLAAERVRLRTPYIAADPTYEEIYYVLEQLDDDNSEEYENPALEPMQRLMAERLAALLAGRERESRPNWSVDELISEGALYVRDVAWRLLQAKPRSPGALQPLVDACQAGLSGSVEIFTLNHDVTLETHLRSSGIAVVDGFGEPEGDVRYWYPIVYDANQPVRLYKLHGSADWFYFQHGPAAVGIPVNGDQWHTRDPHGRLQWPLEGRPLFLCGTFNKILRYQLPLFAELHVRLITVLRHCRRMLVIGYGFRDKAINTRIQEWMRDHDSRMVIVHPNPSDLTIWARPALQRALQQWRDEGRLVFAEHMLEGATWSKLRQALGV